MTIQNRVRELIEQANNITTVPSNKWIFAILRKRFEKDDLEDSSHGPNIIILQGSFIPTRDFSKYVCIKRTGNGPENNWTLVQSATKAVATANDAAVSKYFELTPSKKGKFIVATTEQIRRIEQIEDDAIDQMHK